MLAISYTKFCIFSWKYQTLVPAKKVTLKYCTRLLCTMQLKQYLDCNSMDIRPYSSNPSSAVVVLSSQRRTEQLLREGSKFVTVRRYWWLTDSGSSQAGAGAAGSLMRVACRRLLIPGLGIGLIGMGIGLLRYWKAL